MKALNILDKEGINQGNTTKRPRHDDYIAKWKQFESLIDNALSPLDYKLILRMKYDIEDYKKDKIH